MERSTVVIGGGIVGTSIAHELQLKGAATVLVERDVEPQGASAFSFASLSSFDERQRDVYLLKNHGMIAWRRLAKTLGEDLGVSFPGELRWAESIQGERLLAELFERAHGRGYPVQRLSGENVKKLEPASECSGTFMATYATEDGRVEPLKAIRTLRDAFRAAGGTLLVGRASLVVEASGITVRVGEERVQASHVVVAAGAETSALLERLGWDIPMDPSPGLLCVTEPMKLFLNRTVYVYLRNEVPMHLRQLGDGRVLIGEGAQDHVARNPTIEHARMLLDHARTAFPVLDDAAVDHFTVEWRPMPRDRMPVVGRMPGLDSLYVATAHSGVTLAPALAQFVAREIVQSEEVALLKSFRPSRFAARGADAYRSVEEAFSRASDVFLG